ncbi:MAG: NADPH-dependent 7-cyano-7-deazaguanine reductase QueF [Gammaproteobacteria bacterium]|nr:MAG: NADPH-dependent 7-cyano-7-deazaguanine reductase QueF [Gammaproteobacteria bacterium]RLA57225.1 MAG: NADPH-dependent 7-cyano-7-deazaguanine reductase QueF [Gammaproteobacteria bacterium]
MADDVKHDMLLGVHTPLVDEYSPQLLYPIPRSEARDRLGLKQPLPFAGADLWYAYEMSWLDHTGKPVARVGRFTIPASSPNMVESKSFKLYLNSLNNTCFISDEVAAATIKRDIGTVVGEDVTLELFDPDDRSLAGTRLSAVCLDDLPVAAGAVEPEATMLTIESTGAVEEQLYSHLLRSLCPVTAQPDWATVWIHYRGARIDHISLLQYIIAYRRHQEFHEQCVERMYNDIWLRGTPEFLHIQAFYTRRGGLDINPFRSSDPAARPLPRLNRQ